MGKIRPGRGEPEGRRHGAPPRQGNPRPRHADARIGLGAGQKDRQHVVFQLRIGVQQEDVIGRCALGGKLIQHDIVAAPEAVVFRL